MTLRNNKIPSIASHLNEAVSEALDEVAQEIVDGAQMRVPRATGALHDAIHVEIGDENERRVVAGDGGDVFYGHMVEHGTSHSPPHPFLIPAFEAKRRDTEKTIARALDILAKRGR